MISSTQSFKFTVGCSIFHLFTVCLDCSGQTFQETDAKLQDRWGWKGSDARDNDMTVMHQQLEDVVLGRFPWWNQKPNVSKLSCCVGRNPHSASLCQGRVELSGTGGCHPQLGAVPGFGSAGCQVGSLNDDCFVPRMSQDIAGLLARMLEYHWISIYSRVIWHSCGKSPFFNIFHGKIHYKWSFSVAM